MEQGVDLHMRDGQPLPDADRQCRLASRRGARHNNRGGRWGEHQWCYSLRVLAPCDGSEPVDSSWVGNRMVAVCNSVANSRRSRVSESP